MGSVGPVGKLESLYLHPAFPAEALLSSGDMMDQYLPLGRTTIFSPMRGCIVDGIPAPVGHYERLL